MEYKSDSENASDPHANEASQWVPTEDGIQAFENIKALGRKEIAEGRGDSPISRAIKILIEEIEKIS